MMSKSQATKLPANEKSGNRAAQQQFVAYALTMSWQLAIAVLVPVVGGVELDKAIKSGNLFLFVGLGVAVIASGLVMWRTVQAANRLPVPKLTPAQKRKIQKQYEEDDN